MSTSQRSDQALRGAGSASGGDPEATATALLARILAIADELPFLTIGHVIEHVVPEARLIFPKSR